MSRGEAAVWRGVVFGLASTSFACLLGQLYGLWTMRAFGGWVLPPATALLALLFWRCPREPSGWRNPRDWIVHGALGGLLAALAYDLYRLPFVLGGAPLFSVFPQFGELLLGAAKPRWAVQVIGWTYHFSNGAALGVMFLAMAAGYDRPRFLRGAVAWALSVEALLLLSPYTAFFHLKLDARYLVLTATAHLVFGVVLGGYCRRRFAWDQRVR